MVNEVKIKMTADDLASGKIKDVGNSAESTADKFRNMRGTFLAMGAAGTAITGVLALFTKSALEQQIGINLLDNSLKNVGTSYEAEKEAIEGVIGALQDKTNFGDEEQRESLSTLIALTGDYEISLKALAVITDMATAMDMDFKNASILVAKALAGQTSSLTRYGIQIDSSATKTEILASLTEKFGGAAEAARNPMTQLGNRTGDVSQAMGDVLLPIVESLLPALEGLAKSTVEFMENNKGLTAAVVILAGALGALLIVGGTVGLLIPTIAFAYTGLTTAVTAAAAAKAIFTANLWANVAAWVGFHAATGGVFLAIAAALAGIVLGSIWVVKNIDKVLDAFRNLYNSAIPHINGVASALVDAVNIMIRAKNLLGDNIDEIVYTDLKKWEKAYGAAGDSAEELFEITQTGFKETAKVVKEETQEMTEALDESSKTMLMTHEQSAEDIVRRTESKYARLKKERWANVRDEMAAGEELEKVAEEEVKTEREIWDEKRALFQWQADFQRDLNRQKLNDALQTAAAADAAEKALAEDNLAKFNRIREAVMRLPNVISSNLGLNMGGAAGSGVATAMGVLKSHGAAAGFNAAGQLTAKSITGKDVIIRPVNVSVNVEGDLLGEDMETKITNAMQDAAQKGAFMDFNPGGES